MGKIVSKFVDLKKKIVKNIIMWDNITWQKQFLMPKGSQGSTQNSFMCVKGYLDTFGKTSRIYQGSPDTQKNVEIQSF